MGNSINGAEKNLIKMRGFVSFIVYANKISLFFHAIWNWIQELRLAKRKKNKTIAWFDFHFIVDYKAEKIIFIKVQPTFLRKQEI